MLVAIVLQILLLEVGAIKNGKGLTPPMGWRSWNAFGANVTQKQIEGIMDAMLTKRGAGKSLLELGFSDVGLDDGWQACGDGVFGGFHTQGGEPLVNLTKFPNLATMTRKAHKLGLTIGWYFNNCLCPETSHKNAAEITAQYDGDVEAFVEYGFDSVKLDHCGQFNNLDRWATAFEAAKPGVVIENCHWIGLVPRWDEDSDELWCPFNFFRVSGDIKSNYDSVITNLQTMPKWADLDKPISQPGCWAYLDMLEVGNLPTFEQNRAHFSAWVITSSPLILGIDLTNASKMDMIWPIISNEEVIAVNQNWAGHPGTVVFTKHMDMDDLMPAYPWAVRCNTSDPHQEGWQLKFAGAKYQIASKMDMCLDATVASPMGLSPCNPTVLEQLFDVTADGKILFTLPSGKQQCVEVYGKTGPVLQRTECYAGAPKHQRFSITDGTWADFGERNNSQFPPRCVAARSRYPIDLSAHYISWQIWAKPQPEGAVAVLILNRAVEDFDTKIEMSTVTEVYGDRFLPSKAVTQWAMRDLYEQKDLGTFIKTFPTGRVAKGDSRFFLMTAVKAPLPLFRPENLVIGMMIFMICCGIFIACYSDRMFGVSNNVVKPDEYSDSDDSDEDESEPFSVQAKFGHAGNMIIDAFHGQLPCGKPAQIMLFVVLWWSAAIFVTLMFKLTAGNIKNQTKLPPFFLTFLVNTTTGLMSFLLSVVIAGQGGKLPPATSMERVQVIGLGVIQGCEIGSLNKSLQYLSISERTMLQNFNILLMMLTAQLCNLERLTFLRVVAALLLVAGGIAQGWATTQQEQSMTENAHWRHLIGYGFMMSSMALTSFKWSLIQYMTQCQKPDSYLGLMSTMQLAARIQPITGFVCLLLALIFEFEALSDPAVFFSKQLFRVPAIGLGITMIMCSELKLVKLTSAVATGVLMNLHHIPMVVAGIVFFHDTVAMYSVYGFALCLAGGFCYAAARYQDHGGGSVH